MQAEADASPVKATPNPSVNAILEVLLSGVKEVLGTRFSGLYLYGSLAGGDFDPERSDIDFLVVTDGELPGAFYA
jgi:predicted nucleotidyltransferase